MLIVDVHGLPANYPGIVYVGRDFGEWKGGPLANQFKGKDAVNQFSQWLKLAIDARDEAVMTALRELTETSVLGCWCCCCQDDRPPNKRVCHAETIAAAWRWCIRNKVFEPRLVNPAPEWAQV